MPNNRSSERRYHIQAKNPNGATAVNGLKVRPDPHPETVFRRHLNRFIAILVLMLAFLALAYFIVVQTWEWRHRKFTKDVPSHETAANVPRKLILSAGTTNLLPAQAERAQDNLRQAEMLAREGDAQAEAGNYAAAIRAYTQALAYWPDMASVYPKLGRLHLRTQAYNRARYTLEKASQYYPDDPDLFNDLGVAFLYLGRFDRAASQFEAALTLNPDHAPAHFNRALCRRAMGDETGALSALDRFLQLRPDDPQGLKEKAFFLAAHRDYAGALELLNRAIAGAPRWPAVYFDAAATAALLNHTEEAVEFLRQAEQLASSAAVYLALQQPAFSAVRSNEVVLAFQRGLLERAKAARDPNASLHKPAYPEPMTSFQRSLSL